MRASLPRASLALDVNVIPSSFRWNDSEIRANRPKLLDLSLPGSRRFDCVVSRQFPTYMYTQCETHVINTRRSRLRRETRRIHPEKWRSYLLLEKRIAQSRVFRNIIRFSGQEKVRVTIRMNYIDITRKQIICANIDWAKQLFISATLRCRDYSDP